MEENSLSVEQQQAVAVAKARRRKAEAEGGGGVSPSKQSNWDAAHSDDSIPTEENLKKHRNEAQALEKADKASRSWTEKYVAPILEVPLALGSGLVTAPLMPFVQKNMGYEPVSRTSRDILEGISKLPEKITGSSMGFGPLPETWVLPHTQAPTEVRAALNTPEADIVKAGAKKLKEAPVEFAGKTLVGTTQPETTALAKRAEKMGFKLESAQTKKEKPLGSPGFMEKNKKINEDLATKLVTKETGKEVTDVTPAFIKERQDKLGKEYDQIFGRNFTIDSGLVSTLQRMAEFESKISPADTRPVTAAARNIVDRWKKEYIQSQSQQLQKQMIRQIKKAQPRGGVSGFTRAKGDFPNARKAGEAGAPAYAQKAEDMVKELTKQMGFKVEPEIYFGTPRRTGLYGQASPTGWMIINDTLSETDAISTILHEFGHQAEFQLLRYAPQDEQAAVMTAWKEQMKKTPLGKTVEQHRPITAEKYGKANREQVPDAKFEKEYLRNFQEWFAEQTSRWITKTEAPTNTVEKFFKNVADHWKAIYQRVTGYLPMVKEVDNFFRRNWKGEMVGEAAEELGFFDNVNDLPKDITAQIDGRELQRLRSEMQRISRTAVDGNDRNAAREFVAALDEGLGRYNPAEFEKLKQTNREYAAVATLRDGIEQGFVTQGKVSLQGMGDYLSKNAYGYGAGTSGHPLYELGYMGQKLNMRSREQGIQFPKYGAIDALIGRGKHVLGSMTLGRTQAARGLQRKASEIEQARLQEMERQRLENAVWLRNKALKDAERNQK